MSVLPLRRPSPYIIIIIFVAGYAAPLIAQETSPLDDIQRYQSIVERARLRGEEGAKEAVMARRRGKEVAVLYAPAAVDGAAILDRLVGPEKEVEEGEASGEGEGPAPPKEEQPQKEEAGSGR